MKQGRFVTISGCSGGGKSTLLAELARRGHATVDEPGRRIVRAELATGGQALPWIDPVAFALKAIETARADIANAADDENWTFFDRGLVDAASALEHATGQPITEILALHHRAADRPIADQPIADQPADDPPALARFHRKVFLTPPWPEIHETDAERRHDFAEAEAEYRRLLTSYATLGFQPIILPKLTVQERANLVEQALRP